MVLVKIKIQSKLILRLRFHSSFDSNKDYFKILGVPKNASEAQIKQQYYKLARMYHPDHNKGNQQQIKLINQAYAVLSDHNSKRQYENSRASQQDSPRSQYNQYHHAYQNRNSHYRDPFRPYHGGFWQDSQRTTQRQYSRHAYNCPEYENPYTYYSRYREYAEEAHREFMRKQKEKYESEQQTEDQRLTSQQYAKVRKMLKSSFIAGFLISLIFLIPQMLIGPYGYENKNSYKVKETNRYAYPYQQAEPIEYKNPRYAHPPESSPKH